MGKSWNDKVSLFFENELTTSGVDRFVQAFDYTNQEWAEIELTAQWARTGPLTEEVRQRLRRAGTVYLAISPASRDCVKQNELTFATNWASISELAADLSNRLVAAHPRSIIERKYSRLLQLLAELQDDSSKFSGRSLPLPPRENYYREIFAVWVDQLGGKLGISRDAASHKLGGPLVKFFLAVTQPVLIVDAPALESIARIIDRERERRKNRRKTNRRTYFQKSGSAEEPVRDYSSHAYTDLGPFQTNPGLPFDTQVHDYVVDRTCATGAQHLVAMGADGQVLAHGYGLHLLRGSKFLEALDNPANKIVLHIGRATDTSLSGTVMFLLGSPGLDEIWLHGLGGKLARGTLTAEARVMLRGNTPQEARERLHRIHTGLVLRFYRLLKPSVRTGAFANDQAETVHQHLVTHTLCRAGIIDYYSEQDRGAERGARRA
jgi:hypothetical protein